jgi:hypothetical protein
VLSISNCSQPSDPWKGMLTYSVFSRRLDVLAPGTAQSRPINRNLR